MTNILTLTLLLISFFDSAQETFSFSMPLNQEVYRGVDNYILVNSGSSNTDFTVACPNCDTIYPSTLENTYVVRTGLGRYVELLVVSQKDPETVLAKQQFQCFNLPDPILFFGASRNGTKCAKSAGYLFAKYPPEMNRDETFEVIDWKLFAGEKKFVGEGRALSQEAKDHLISMMPGDGIAIIVVVKGPDGILRKIAGAYVI